MIQLEPLVTALHKLAKHRKRLAELKSCYTQLFKKFQKSHQVLLLDIDLQEQALAGVEKEVKGLAKALFRQAGYRNTCSGVSIGQPKRFIYDLDEAYYYALTSEYRDRLLCLDTKEFEKHCIKMAETGVELAFVYTYSEMKLHIARDLEKALQFYPTKTFERNTDGSNK